jgi:hypothetical protein
MKQAGALGRVVLVGLMWLPPAGFAQSAKASATQDWAELALRRCLYSNYAALNALDRSKIKDFSLFMYGVAKNESLSYDALNKLNDWTESQTSHFHQEDAPMKTDSTKRPVNVVFYRCMQFYKSRELRAFIQREVLPLQ